jgi:hypothetical protein
VVPLRCQLGFALRQDHARLRDILDRIDRDVQMLAKA